MLSLERGKSEKWNESKCKIYLVKRKEKPEELVYLYLIIQIMCFLRYKLQTLIDQLNRSFLCMKYCIQF